MNLVIDIGNTSIKTAVFEADTLQAFLKIPVAETVKLKNFSLELQPVKACLVSSVKPEPLRIIDELGLNCKVLLLDQYTIVPFRNSYQTPGTLGKDRLAGVASAFFMFPGSDILVIDAGTAITYDLLTSEGEYLGGAISPGINMRYKALHTFTGMLPLLEQENDAELIGNSTTSSIHSGVLNGVLFEVDRTIVEYMNRYPALKIILTGGDVNYFDKQLKVKTFAAPNLVLQGLNYLLNFNLEKH